MAKSHSKKDDEAFELGKKLQAFYEMGYVSKRQALLFSFLKGIASGAGAFFGGTVVIAVVLWILSLFDELTFISEIISRLNS